MSNWSKISWLSESISFVPISISHSGLNEPSNSRFSRISNSNGFLFSPSMIRFEREYSSESEFGFNSAGPANNQPNLLFIATGPLSPSILLSKIILKYWSAPTRISMVSVPSLSNVSASCNPRKWQNSLTLTCDLKGEHMVGVLSAKISNSPELTVSKFNLTRSHFLLWYLLSPKVLRLTNSDFNVLSPSLSLMSSKINVRWPPKSKSTLTSTLLPVSLQYA